MSKKRIVIILLIIAVFILAIISSFFYYKDKYIVSFETGTNEMIMTQYINKNSKITEPITPTKDGYIFVEWQLNGKKYDFDSNVNENIILTAKWMKEEYIKVTYNTDSLYTIEPIKILKGSSITNLPITYKDGYEFIGWYLNDKLYENEIVNDDVILIAKYKPNKINTSYKVGNSVIITGNYSSSAYSMSAEYDAAIGWNRKILYIIEDAEYPYAIGNDEGVTGFFKIESIKLNVKEGIYENK